MQIKRFIFNPFQVNSYLLYDETREAILIDAAMMSEQEKQIFSQFIEDKQLILKGLYNTHGHMDHIAGTAWIKRKYMLNPQGHQADNMLVDTALQHAKLYGIEMEAPEPVREYIDKEHIIRFGNQALEVRHVPGHSPGGLAFVHHKNKYVFSGDSLFQSSVGRTDLPGGDMEQLIQSIHTELLSLDGNYTVYPGHGPETTIEIESKENPYL
jgi:glyoxylase-like metal-dependent hydrolase (beta-lactamase superfamily II)